MSNFGRVLRQALNFRFTVAGTLICALAVAVLWGGNITAVYPIADVVFQGRSLSQWVDAEIDRARGETKSLEESARRSAAQLQKAPPSERRLLAAQLATAEERLTAERRALRFYQWIKAPIDRYLPRDPFQTLVVIICLLVLGTVIKDVFLTIGCLLVDRVAHLTTFDLRNEFYRRTLRLDLAAFGDSGTSDLLSRFTYDMDAVSGGIQTVFGRAVREPLKMLACLAAAGWICWRLLLLSLIIAPLAGYLIALLAKTLKRANRKAMEEMSALYNVLVETFSAIKVVKAFTMERHERRRFHAISKKCYRKAMRIALFDSLVSPVTEFMGICTISLAILAGAYLVLKGETHLMGIKMSDRPLTYGSLLVFYGMLAGVSDPARKLSEVFNRIQRAAAASDRVYHCLDREPTIVDCDNPQPLPRHHREIAFDNVHFGYSPEHLVLERINLRIAAGETIAIVGPNGCGKSTLANLIPRLYDSTAGVVSIDHKDVRQVRLADLRRQIGIVTQETLLFDDTVFNNIRYGAPHATRDEVIEAAKRAHAHRFIEQRLEHGYQTMVGSHGSRLSGGQRQRIALARAILRDPAILILDEATSQIDLESEQLIHKVLEQFARNRTAIIITHRLATLALADRIVVMEAGSIIDVGTHEQLLARCDLYRRLYQIQFKETA